MLSLIDLLDAGTVDLPLAGYLAAAMRAGSSLLVGARPGGAGKTTVMCALLNFLPDDAAIVTVDNPSVAAAARKGDGACYIAHEISAGPCYAYIWGGAARAFLALAGRGHTIASNLHTDTIDEARDQLCATNGVATGHFNAVHLMVFIRLVPAGGHAVRREIAAVHERDGTGHRLVWRGAGGAFDRVAPSTLVTPADEARHVRLLDKLRGHNVREIDAVRRAALDAPGRRDSQSTHKEG